MLVEEFVDAIRSRAMQKLAVLSFLGSSRRKNFFLGLLHFLWLRSLEGVDWIVLCCLAEVNLAYHNPLLFVR